MEGAGRVLGRARWAFLDHLGDAEPAEALRDPAAEATARYHELRDAVYRYVVYALRNPGEAEEITQDAFLKLYRALKGGQRIDCVPAWLFTVARNLSRDRTRRPERRLTQLLPQSGWQSLERTIPSGEPSCEDRLVDAARQHEVSAALEVLTDTQRECFQLRIEGLRYREIAEILGMSVCGVADAVQRAVRKLRERVVD